MTSGSSIGREYVQITLFSSLLMAGIFIVSIAVRERKNDRQCHRNLKQLNLGLMQYLRDYDERGPAASEWSTLYPYIKCLPCFSCPKATNGYAFNRYLHRIDIGSVQNIKDTPTFYDSALIIPNATDTGASWMKPGRHRGGGNVAFLDGYVKWMAEKPAFFPIQTLETQNKKATHRR